MTSGHHVTLALFFLKAGKCNFLRLRLSSSLSAVELESVESVSSSIDITIGNSRSGFLTLVVIVIAVVIVVVVVVIVVVIVVIIAVVIVVIAVVVVVVVAVVVIVAVVVVVVAVVKAVVER